MKRYHLVVISFIFVWLNAMEPLTSKEGAHTNILTTEEEYYTQAAVYDTDNVAGRINNISKFLTDQLFVNKNFGRINDPLIAITSLVYSTELDKTNRLGRILSENLIHDFQVRGFKVIDYKIMPVIKVTADGDIVLSRNINELKSKHFINYVTTGTITDMYNGVVLNVRIVDLSTNIVLSTAQVFIDKKTYYTILKRLSLTEEKTEPAPAPEQTPKP